MRILLVALLLTVVLCSSAMSQMTIVPDGAIAPNGALVYSVPGGPASAMGNGMFGACSDPSVGVNQTSAPFLFRGPAYPVSYPVLWVPMWIAPDTANQWPNVPNRSE